MTTAITKPADIDLQREALVREIDRLTGELHNARQRLHELNREDQKRDYEQATSGTPAGASELESLGFETEQFTAGGDARAGPAGGI
ncbi:MAG: hypothetical protein IID44_29765 [Planctomycetes bacterium]|nr:hypothetical protein [Planctomycetota bacterium]